MHVCSYTDKISSHTNITTTSFFATALASCSTTEFDVVEGRCRRTYSIMSLTAVVMTISEAGYEEIRLCGH